MIDDAFVFDCVAHVFNFDPKNAFGNAGLMFDNHLYAFHNALTPDDQPKLPPEEFLRQWTPSDIRKMVYEESDTDMLVAMPLPLTDLFQTACRRGNPAPTWPAATRTGPSSGGR